MAVPAWLRRPEWTDALVEDVDRAFAQTGRETPGWPDPHQGRAPDEEEYSRCLDPGKYEILVTRLVAWGSVLEARGAASIEERSAEVSTWFGALRSDADIAWVRALVPTVAGGCSLLLARTVVEEGPFGLDLGLAVEGGPAALVSTVPGCGCDACDDGSDSLLEELDAFVLSTARGGMLHTRAAGSTSTAMLDGWRGTGDPSETWLDPSVAPSGPVAQWVGVPWL